MFNSDQKRAFTAVLLSGVVLFGWQYYFSSKVENKVASPVTVAAENSKIDATVPAVVSKSEIPVVEDTSTISKLELSSDTSKLEFTNGLTFLNATTTDSTQNLVQSSGLASSLKVKLLLDNGPVDLVLTQTESSSNFLKLSNAQYGINLTFNSLPNGKFKYKFESQTPYKFQFVFTAKEHKDSNGQVRQYVTYSKDSKFIAVAKDDTFDGNFRWLGIDYNYHLFALVFDKAETLKIVTTEKGEMIADTTTKSNIVSGSIIFAKKNYDHLIAISEGNENLHLSVDFGFFAILAVPTLRGLQFIYKYIPNYGLAIILLTIFLRLITFPLQYKSFKSMKKMQAIQPELLKIKEKYKDDNVKMQKETMALFQKAGANPLSGCLPLLLQMPFFFAIYRVLYSAVELVGAPFFGWIHDLSNHDPFYVLPLLMAGSMFLQQKMTPQTSMDPTQQKIMLFMPIIFGFIMKDLPAGLVLYIFVSTMVGILQQYLVYKAID
jgi:YidC/Oxa1 family membrane protein insertase